MKKFFAIFAVAASLVCACNKYDGAISDLEKRVDSAEQSISDLVSRVEALQKLVDALNAGVSIVSVSPAEGGFTVNFSDGSSFTVVNGSDAAVSYTDDGLCYVFDFGDGNTVSVSKAGAFGIKVDSDNVELEPGVPATIAFEVVGADETTKVLVEDCPFAYELGDEYIEISAEKVVPASFILKAVRNSDGANSAVVISVVKKPIGDVTIDVEVSGITETGALVTMTPSNKTVAYYYAIEQDTYVNSFSSDAELMEAELDYWYAKYGADYADYGYSSFEELFLENFCYVGDVVENSDYVDYLKPSTNYVAYAFAVDEDLTILSETLGKCEFTTLDEPELDATFLGTAIWHDVFASGVFTMDGVNLDLPVDVYEDNIMPGVFYFDSPYNYANIAGWFDCEPEEMEQYTGNWRKALISIDASNPDKVVFPMQDLGVCLNSSYGWFAAGSIFEGVELSTGTYKDGVISFDGYLYTSMSKYNPSDPWDDMNEDGSFTITMPSSVSGAPVKSFSARQGKLVAKRFIEAGHTFSSNFAISK